MHNHVINHSFVASGAGVQRRFVNFAGAQAGAADQVLGVAMVDFSSGQLTTAHVGGVAGVESGAAVALGAPVVPDATGRAVAGAVDAVNRIGFATNAVTGPGQTVFLLFR